MLDLWPEDIEPISELKGPASILRKQAFLLGKKTNNLVEAEVVWIEPSILETRQFNYAFLIVAPALGNYRYELFTISHGIDPYPITINVDEDIQAEFDLTELGEKLVAESEREFVEILKKIFSAKKTKKIIGTLLSMIIYESKEGESPS